MEMESDLIWTGNHDEWKNHLEIGGQVKIINDPTTPAAIVQKIAGDIVPRMDNEKEYWPVRQALAFCRYTPEDILRSLFARQEWHLLIGLANNLACPRDILEYFADLAVEACGAHKGYGGYDQNKELRGIARKRLDIPEFEYPKEFKSLYKDLNEYIAS